ncbi:hypothetical protein PG985_007128 [Apiospora marii]|uniref:Uncharacterized protein n=1 Tax=Apiospora marii TaxID=335849 RepID=A0ABR1SG82_9PEZI
MCDCKVKTYKYTACQHRSKTRILCWKASWRTTNFLCLGQVLSKCKPKKEKKERFGLCTRCTHHFLPYHINDPKYVRRYMEWKQRNGYEGKKVDAQVVPIEAVFHVKNSNKRGKFHQQSPMLAQQQRSVDSFDLAAAGALDSDYAGSAYSRTPVDLSDLPQSLSADLGPPSFRGRAHAGGRMLDLYRGSRSNTDIRETPLSPCNERKLTEASIRLNPAPKKPHWRKSKADTGNDDRRGSETFFVVATPSPASRTGFVGHVRSRSHTAVPVPPPQPVREIFLGCFEHKLDRQPACANCTEAYFRERGVPNATFIRKCHSAPPGLVRVRTPGGRFTSAAQALCICDRYGRDNCLACYEKEQESLGLQATFF